jgi:hypothetical protein
MGLAIPLGGLRAGSRRVGRASSPRHPRQCGSMALGGECVAPGGHGDRGPGSADSHRQFGWGSALGDGHFASLGVHSRNTCRPCRRRGTAYRNGRLPSESGIWYHGRVVRHGADTIHELLRRHAAGTCYPTGCAVYWFTGCPAIRGPGCDRPRSPCGSYSSAGTVAGGAKRSLR